ncbi:MULTISPECIES: sporulation protein YabP [Bacillus]|uniref:Spore coat protein n=1 Tax=Bacillus zhangzhouensis TaxID=1178540 RepID=A0A081L7G3_9BACI|nr:MULTISPECIES: sporulation protein YabP [Bacillus]KEP25189.1 spore coat protein [Bacillus zhangzhouensis]MDR0127206.1 sporulation protein YabP [Bacillus zhangzhouensis]PRO39543.1 sporulation protein YabP [Bacillus sp. LLTC93]
MNQYYNQPQGTKLSSEAEHNVTMRSRKHLDITGVKQVESFDNEEFLLETVMGILAIRGENLQMKNLDVEKGVVSIKGRVFDLIYVDEQHGEKAKGFFSKLFK